MIKIVADSSTLYSREEAKQNHLDIRPLSVTINNKSYKELEELTTEGLVEMINEGYKLANREIGYRIENLK